jgi:hypothetical protein
VSDHQHCAEEADNLPYRHVQESVVSRGLQILDELHQAYVQENTTLLLWLIGDLTQEVSF